MNTFSASAEFGNGTPLFWYDGWTAAVHGQLIRLHFHPQAICASRDVSIYRTDWAAGRFTLTVVTDSAPRYVAPLPSTHQAKSYSWNTTKLTCGQLPRIALTVPISLTSYLSTVAYASSPDGIQINEIVGWSYPIIVALLALVLTFRMRRFLGEQQFVLNLIFLASLGLLLAVVDFTFSSNGLWSSTELVAVYVVALVVVLRLRSPRTWTAVVIAIILMAAIALAAYRFRTVILPSAAIAQEVISFLFLITIGVAGCSAARSFCMGSENDMARWPSINYLRDFAIFWAGAALAIALSYSLGNVYSFSSPTDIVFSEFSTLRYPLAAFATTLVAVALVIPFALRGPRARGPVVTAALFGMSFVAQLPALTVAAISVPGGEALFVLLLYLFAIKSHEESRDSSSSSPSSRLHTSLPKVDPTDNAILAVKIGATLAVIPVAYFAYTTITSLPKTLQQPGPGMIFVVASIIGQLAGWILIGVVFAGLAPRLRGGVGPVRALVVSATWFVAAFIIHIVDNWTHQPSPRSWSFFGLELLLFLVAFSVAWDAYVLADNPWKSSLGPAPGSIPTSAD